jgi:MFS transporter, OPA family, glycerol-3-phosphate transporter
MRFEPSPRTTAAILVVGYAAFFLCRSNVDAALPLWSRAYGYDKVELGRLSAIAVLAYGVGKLVLGMAADVLGGRRMILVAIGGSVAASLLIGMSTGLLLLTVLAATNRFFQSGGWIGVVGVASRWFPRDRHGAFMGVVSTSYEAGSVLSLLLCGGLVRMGLGWRWLFVVNPLLFCTVGILVAISLSDAPRELVSSPAASVAVRSPARRVFGETLPWLGRQRSFWIALLLSFLLTFIRTGFLTWTPMFLAELGAADGQGVGGAILKSAVFPAAGVVGALAAGWLSDRAGVMKRAPVIAAGLGLLFIAIVLLSEGGIRDPRLAIVALAACGLCLLGPYSLIAGALALDIAKGRGAAMAAGMLDAAGYVGGSLSGIILGSLAERSGWGAVFRCLAGAALAGLMVAGIWTFRGRVRLAEPQTGAG